MNMNNAILSRSVHCTSVCNRSSLLGQRISTKCVFWILLGRLKASILLKRFFSLQPHLKKIQWFNSISLIAIVLLCISPPSPAEAHRHSSRRGSSRLQDPSSPPCRFCAWPLWSVPVAIRYGSLIGFEEADPFFWVMVMAHFLDFLGENHP